MNRVKGYHFDWSANELSNNVAMNFVKKIGTLIGLPINREKKVPL
jgi:hypothetical protein